MITKKPNRFNGWADKFKAKIYLMLAKISFTETRRL